MIGNRIADNHRQIWETKRWLSGAFPDALLFGGVAELADASDLKSVEHKFVRVRVSSLLLFRNVA